MSKVLNPLTITPSGAFTRASTATYFDNTGALQTASNDVPRYTHDPVTLAALGILLELATTNVLLNTATLSTQTRTVTAQSYTLSFWGTGTITLSGVAAATVIGTGTTRKTYTFTPTAGSLTLTVTGTVTRAQLEAGDATSYVPSTGTPGARAADVMGATFLTNIPEPQTTGTNADPALAYNPVTAYAINDTTYSATTHRKYRSRQAANTGNDPTLATADTPTAWWEDIGATCAYSGLDLRKSTAGCRMNSVVYVLKPGKRFDMIAIDDVVGATARIYIWRNGGILRSYEIDMIERNTTTWYEYVHGQFSFRSGAIRFDLPPYVDAVACIVIDYPGSEAQLGAVGLGMAEDIGNVQFEAEADALNFSKIDRNFDGSISTLIPRLNVPQVTQTVWTDHDKVNRVRQLRDAMNGRVGFYCGLEDETQSYFEALYIRGIYRRWAINLKHNDHAVLSLTLEKV